MIGAQLTQRLAVDHLPQALDMPVLIEPGAQLQVDLARIVVLIGVDVRQHRLVMVAVLVMQHGPRTAAQLDMGQVETVTVAGVGFTAAQAAQQHQLLLTGAHQGEVLHCVIMRLALLGQREHMLESVIQTRHLRTHSCQL